MDDRKHRVDYTAAARGRAHSRKKQVQKLGAINEVFWVLVGSAVNWGAVLFYPLMPFLYGEWTRHNVVLNKPLLGLMLASVVVTNSGALMALHLNGINSLRIVFAASVVRAMCSLGGGALGYRFLGLSSFGLGILAGELIATLMTGRHFLKHELCDRGFQFSATTCAPVALGTGSAVLYLVGSGFGWWSGGLSWLLALTGVAAASILGWKALERDLRGRLPREIWLRDGG